MADTEHVVVRRQWNDSAHQATYRLADVRGFHWSWQSGGVKAPAPRAYIHAYVLCDAMLDGDLSHSCRHGPPPHEIKVCIVKKDNPKLFAQIEKQAGEKPNRHKTI
ncbi:hypothetical protein [Magnetospirillum sp. ME-1]|uniref:hypothetical protein n=1 Tax=Magnetospirillum sp. ME-1 TaxID=1639348 RepID=UPI0011AE1EE5|nr:hypothetical protein [Magnetospirillum sp. ME-1]